jgi:hypothetical protein
MRKFERGGPTPDVGVFTVSSILVVLLSMLAILDAILEVMLSDILFVMLLDIFSGATAVMLTLILS